ncbi:MAG TPA: alkaline phosphatase family protein [Terriglobales bacterium]|nr:alkaline phosphatase family protein [Terriglobales bacterium]
MSLLKPRKRTRACVIGLDGVPYGMIAGLAARGVMPAAARLIAAGHLHKMKASLPEISAVSWTNFMTGRNPGTHGIFGFTDFRPGSYAVRFPNSLDVQSPAIWDKLRGSGRRSIVINQPSTYPARPIEGVLISGFVAVELAKAVHPPAFRETLERIGYRTDIDTMRSREDPEFLWRELSETLAGHVRALDLLWAEPWDYFEFIITGTDRLHHYLWDAYEKEAHPFHERFLEYYRMADRVIDKVATAYEEETGGRAGLYLLSDHGFTGIVQEVALNAWLERNGYLAFDRPDPAGLEDLSAGSRAFALDPNRVYLNVKGRFPKGAVEPSEVPALRREVAAGLAGLEHGGRKAVRRVFEREEIYSGPFASRGPDLLVLGEPGFDMKGSVKKKEVFGRTSLQGMHTWDDAFFWAADDQGPDLAIEDLAAIILGRFS